MRCDQIQEHWPDLRIQVLERIIFQDLEDETVLLDMKNGQYFGLDGVGSRIWQLLVQKTPPEDIVSCLLREFNVTESRCLEDIARFLERLAEKELVEISLLS